MISEWLDTQSLPVFWLAKADLFKQAVSEKWRFCVRAFRPTFLWGHVCQSDAIVTLVGACR